MKVFFYLLVVVNVIFFAVMKSGLLDEGQPVALLPPLHAEKIVLLKETLPASNVVATPIPVSAPIPTPAPVQSSTCYEWGGFTGVDLDKVSHRLQALHLGDKLSQRKVDRVIGYWVYIPPLKSAAAVNLKVAELKARGVTEYFVVPDQGKWLNTISLGVFKTQGAAQNFLAELSTKKVHTARVGERAGKIKATVFIISDLNAAMSARLLVLQKEFSGSDLKRLSCH